MSWTRAKTRIFLDRKAMRQRAKEALAKLGHSDMPLDSPVGCLSASFQQIIEIARAIALGCRVLILDEPTSSLDHNDVAKLFGLLNNLKRQGYAVIYIYIYISHFVEEVRQIADRFTILRDGRVVSSGTVTGITINQIVSEMIGTDLEYMYRHSERSTGQIVLEAKDLTGQRGLKSASFSLCSGEVLGIAGLVGSGRSDLIRTIFGLAPVRSGSIRMLECSGYANPHVRWRQGSGFLSENRKDEGIATSMTLADNIVLPGTKKLETAGLLLPSKKEEAARHWVEKLGIKCSGANAKMSSLSGGNQQKVAFARLLHHEVDVLILDEPTRGIDVQTKSLIYSLIDQLASQGKAILMVSSYLPELLGICDRVAVMRRGYLGAFHQADQLSERDLMLEIIASGRQEDTCENPTLMVWPHFKKRGWSNDGSYACLLAICLNRTQHFLHLG